MDEIQHHFEIMVETIVCFIPGFLSMANVVIPYEQENTAPEPNNVPEISFPQVDALDWWLGDF